jgi:hypothetical protein
MTRTLWTIIFASPLFFLCSCAGTTPPTTLPPEQRTVEYVLDYKHKQDVAFTKVLEWLAANYNDASKVIQV